MITTANNTLTQGNTRSTKKLQFRIDLQAVQGNNDALFARGTINIEIHGDVPFLGLSVWHEERRDDLRYEPFVVLSRTSVTRTGHDSQTFETKRYRVTTEHDLDPLAAAARALRTHLVERLPDQLGQKVMESLSSNPFYRQSYEDQVVEPICTAVLGMCRDASLYRDLADGDRLWAIGTWTLGKAHSGGISDELLELGEQIQDVLVVKDEGYARNQVKRFLL